jgi:flagellar hook-associated protein 3 FlgL
MNTRMTTSMLQRNVLADLNANQAKLSRTQQKVASGKEITKPSDDPFNAARALGLRRDLAANAQYQRSVGDAQGWQEASEQALARITESVGRARDLVLQGASDSADPTSREAIAQEIDQLIEGVKQNANSTYRGSYIFAGSESDAAPYLAGATDAYQGDDAGLDPTKPGVLREIGPGVTMSINVVGREVLGDGGADGKLLATLRGISQHLRAGNGAALGGADLKALDADLDGLLGVRARNGAQTNRLQAASTRLDEVSETVTKQLSNTEDADLAKTLIDFSTQSAAYQAALRAGANIVQNSLMDFLR